MAYKYLPLKPYGTIIHRDDSHSNKACAFMVQWCHRDPAVARPSRRPNLSTSSPLPSPVVRVGAPHLLSRWRGAACSKGAPGPQRFSDEPCLRKHPRLTEPPCPDRKSTRLNSSHLGISYAV